MCDDREPWDWKAYLTGCQLCLIYCHGGCPDGLGAARLTTMALAKIGHSRTEIVELEHTERADKRSEAIGLETAVLYVDISPYPEDIPLLRSARKVVVIDHHASVRDRMKRLAIDLPEMLDLSDLDDNHCACSLVGREMGHLLDHVPDIEKKIALLRKKDVWNWEIPEKWASEARDVSAGLQLQPRVTLDIIDELLENLPAFIERGAQARIVLNDNAEQLFARARVVAEAEHPSQLLVLGVELEECLAYDSRHFAQLCKKYLNAFVVRSNLYSNTEPFIDVRLSCTSENVGALGVIARQLHEQDPGTYIGGGGHPFAAGLQVHRDRYNLDNIAADLLCAAGASPGLITRLRAEDALDVAASPQSFKRSQSKVLHNRVRFASLLDELSDDDEEQQPKMVPRMKTTLAPTTESARSKTVIRRARTWASAGVAKPPCCC